MNTEKPSHSDNELEEQVLRESIVSATGLNQSSLQIGIKGDPSLRKTTLQRKCYESPVDILIEPLFQNIEDLMLNRGIYRVFIDFNSAEIRTSSVFDPLRQDIHTAEKLADPAYVDRQFPKISYEDKTQSMKELYEAIKNSSLFHKIPRYWKNIFIKGHATWEPMSRGEISTIMSSMKIMRKLPGFYLRNITVCIVQDLIRMQFNCDSTQIISVENYQKFLQENMSNAQQKSDDYSSNNSDSSNTGSSSGGLPS